MKLSLLAGACLVMAACSSHHGVPPPSASAPAAPGTTAPAASAIPMQAPAANASSAVPIAPPSHGPALGVILQRPSFAKAFAGMDGASSLPAWAKPGNTATPTAKVQVGGQAMWLAHTCETTSCQTGQMLLLVDPATHTMQGLLVETSGTAGASVQKLTWLGKPDAATQAYLKGKLAHD
ncbi:MAG: Ivy family c-type lysozyme inhibitor [Rhodanobacteraceae bacterium]